MTVYRTRILIILQISRTGILTISTLHLDKREIINTTLKFTPKLSQGHDNISTKIYRPISLLPAFSKLLEKLISKRLIHFLDNCNILCKHQYGFHKNHATIHIISHLLKHIADHNDKPLNTSLLVYF